MSSSRKKRRRSSLASARIRVSLSPGLGLHRRIGLDLSPEERLQQLSAACLQFAVTKLSRETESEDVRDEIESVKDELLKVTDSNEHKEAVQNACQNLDKLLPNPANADMDETIQFMEKRIERLHKEEMEWQAYFADLDRQTQDAERKVENLVLTPSDLSEEQKSLSNKYLPDTVDLSVIKQQKNTNTNRLITLVYEHERNIHIQDQLQTKINKQLDDALTKLHAKTFPNMGSPRASVQHLAEFPTPPPDPLG